MKNEIKIIEQSTQKFKPGDILETKRGGIFCLFIQYNESHSSVAFISRNGQTNMHPVGDFKLAPKGTKFEFAGKIWLQGENNDNNMQVGDLVFNEYFNYQPHNTGVVTRIDEYEAHIVFHNGVTARVDIRAFKKAPSGAAFKCENLGIEITQR